MKPILIIDDLWREMRKDLFGNTEPEVKLEGITLPIGYNNDDLENASTCFDSETFGMEWKSVEILPALAASTSYGSTEKIKGDYEKATALNRKLIKLDHATPLEAIQINFHISGISKICGAQLSRYRSGNGHVSASRRYQTQKPRFVYPVLDYIEDKAEAIERLKKIEAIYKSSYEMYEWLRKDTITSGFSQSFETRDITEHKTNVKPLHKQEARFVIPGATATERTWWVNVRELRHIFKQRLHHTAEMEIRRLMVIIFNMVYPIMPSLLEDIKERFE